MLKANKNLFIIFNYLNDNETAKNISWHSMIFMGKHVYSSMHVCVIYVRAYYKTKCVHLLFDVAKHACIDTIAKHCKIHVHNLSCVVHGCLQQHVYTLPCFKINQNPHSGHCNHKVFCVGDLLHCFVIQNSYIYIYIYI